MWNYRIVRRKWDKGPDTFGIHEAYYDDKKKVHSITEDSVSPFGETRDEVLSCLRMMINDADRAPVLNYEDIPEDGAHDPGDDIPARVEEG